MKKVWKSKAYQNTKVPYEKTQVKIGKLLLDNGVYEKQFTDRIDKSEFIFMKELDVDNKKVKVGVKITIPDVSEKNKNQLYRALFYYLKAKFESLTFGFVEEYNEAFIKEFMPYLIAGRDGRTVADLILPKYNMAIGNVKDDGEQLFLEDKTENE